MEHIFTRFEVINILIKKNQFKSYLEIGTQNSNSGAMIDCEYKVGVDPDPEKRQNNDYHVFYNSTSDEFFIKNTEKYDLIFIDGDHSYRQSKIDFLNALNSITDEGIIVLHDTLPHCIEYTSMLWNGEVFKTLYDIHCSGIKYEVVDSDHGICIVYPNKEISKSVLHDRDIAYNLFQSIREDLNIINPVDFNELMETVLKITGVVDDTLIISIEKIKPIVDVIILSNAKSPELYYMTQRAVSSCYNQSNNKVNIIVVEQNESVEDYELAKTIKIKGIFNYNKFANIGASLGTLEWLMIANNDLVFTENWLDNLIAANHPVVSPKCPFDSRQTSIIDNTIGDIVGKHLSGWAIMLKRDIWKQIGGFDERFTFYCADNAFLEQLKEINILPMLVPLSIVEHLGSKTLATVDNEERTEITINQIRKFNKEFKTNLFNIL